MRDARIRRVDESQKCVSLIVASGLSGFIYREGRRSIEHGEENNNEAIHYHFRPGITP